MGSPSYVYITAVYVMPFPGSGNHTQLFVRITEIKEVIHSRIVEMVFLAVDFSLLNSKSSTVGSGVVNLEGSNSCNSMNSPRQFFSAEDRMLLLFQYIPSWMLLSNLNNKKRKGGGDN